MGDKPAGGVPAHQRNPEKWSGMAPEAPVKGPDLAIEGAGAPGGGAGLIKRRRDASDVWGRKKPTIRAAPALPDMQPVKETPLEIHPSSSTPPVAKLAAPRVGNPELRVSTLQKFRVSTRKQHALPNAPTHPPLSPSTPARDTGVVKHDAVGIARGAPPVAPVRPPLPAQSVTVTVMAVAISPVRDPPFPLIS